jgi:hypothetical protein
MATEPNYWFRAKRYGWGGRLPCSWQGWAVLAAFIVLVLGGLHFVSPGIEPIAYIVFSRQRLS